MSAKAVDHSTITVERLLPARPKHAFRFWSEADLKRRWNDCHPDWFVLEDMFEFRIGGAETKRWRMPDGVELAFRARYIDIIPERRIIYAFDMSFGGSLMSASLATIELAPNVDGTRMLFTEQIAFLGDSEAKRQRSLGTESGFDRLAEVIAMETAVVH